MKKICIIIPLFVLLAAIEGGRRLLCTLCESANRVLRKFN